MLYNNTNNMHACMHTRTHACMHAHAHKHIHTYMHLVDVCVCWGGGGGGGGNRHICEKVSVEIVIELVPVRQIDSDTFRVIDRGHDPRNGIWNYPTGIVKL